MLQRNKHFILGNRVYRRVVEAQEPFSKEEEGEPPKKEEELKEEHLQDDLDELRDKVVKILDNADVKADAPTVAMTKKGFRYTVPVAPVGSLEGSTSILTFDFGTPWVDAIKAGDWATVFSLTGLKNLGISQVVWNYENNQMVADKPEFIKELLTSVSTLQKADARVKSSIFGGVDKDEMDEMKLRDWILNVAAQMAEHGVGTEDYSLIKTVKDTALNLYEQGVTTSQEHGFLIKSINAARPSKDDDKISMNQLVRYIEVGVKEQLLTNKKTQEILDQLRKIEREPVNYFEKERFYRMIQQSAQKGIFDDAEVNNAKKALDTFASDAEWQEALRTKIEKKVSTSVSKEAVIKAVDKWSSKVGYNIEAGIQITLTDEGTIAAAIAAPFPFFYTFDFETSPELTLIEAAMVFFDREIFVSSSANAPHYLLSSDIVLAQCMENAVGLEIGKSTKPQKDTQSFASQLARSLNRRSTQSSST